jgi:hypothetical protein
LFDAQPWRLSSPPVKERVLATELFDMSIFVTFVVEDEVPSGKYAYRPEAWIPTKAEVSVVIETDPV